MRSKPLLIIIIILVLIGLMVVGALSGMGEVRKMVINNVDLSAIADGVYKGSFEKNRWAYDLEVTVASHKITAIVNTNPKTKLAKGFNQKAVEAIIRKQSPKIDAVSGATISTKAFSKAVENALTQPSNTGIK